jgi:hypothetical protein
VRQGEKPLFVFNWSGFFDGGTYTGGGFGYTVYLYDGTLYSTTHGKSITHAEWAKGPAIDFWFLPFLSKSDIHFGSLGDHLKQER